MKFEHIHLPLAGLFSTPFVRWQGALAQTSSLDLAVLAGQAGLVRAGIEPQELASVVLGWTVPQPAIFYGAPWVAARIGAAHATGPMVSQACATSVACLQAAAVAALDQPGAPVLALTTDRTSNGPTLSYPAPTAAGGAPQIEHWVLDNFKRDPWAGEAMIATAEHVAREGGFGRQAIDDLTWLRYRQYDAALADQRAVQRRFMVPIELPSGRGRTQTIDADAGVHPTTREALAELEPVLAAGSISYGAQTHPADGAAGAVVIHRANRRHFGDAVQLLATGFARVERARMPKAPVPAALRALSDAGLTIADVHCVSTHNPFAVNDLWFARETGFALDQMNVYGSSLVYGHPQAPTGLRALCELVCALHARGGGIGLFTGCAAGDTGAAVVVRLDG